MQALAKSYAIVVAAALAYAWWIEVALRDSNREHLLGGVLLALVSFPASLTLGVAYDSTKEVATHPFFQLAWLSVCAVVQVSVLFCAASLVARLGLSGNKYWRRFWS